MLFTICFLILGAIFDSLFLIFVNNIVVRGKGWNIFDIKWDYLLHFLSFLWSTMVKSNVLAGGYSNDPIQKKMFLSIFKCTSSVSFMEMVQVFLKFSWMTSHCFLFFFGILTSVSYKGVSYKLYGV